MLKYHLINTFLDFYELLKFTKYSRECLQYNVVDLTVNRAVRQVQYLMVGAYISNSSCEEWFVRNHGRLKPLPGHVSVVKFL